MDQRLCRISSLVFCLWLIATAGPPQEGLKAASASEDNAFRLTYPSSPNPDVDRVVKVLRTSNKAQTNRYVCAVFDFKNVNPYAVANYFASGLIREEGGVYSFLGPDGTSGKLLVICPEYQIETYAEMAKMLDRKDLTSAPGSTYIYHKLDHRSASDPQFLDILRQYVSPNAVVMGDLETNSVLLFDSASGATYCSEALRAGLDSPTQQVVVEVKIYETTSSNDGRLGLDYEAWKNGPGQSLFEAGASGRYFRRTNPSLRNTRLERHASFALDYPSEFFDFLVEKGRAKLLTRTELAAMNKTAASLFTGDAILYFKEDVAGGTYRTVEQKASTDVVDEKIGQAKAGVQLKMTPIVGQQMVNLDLEIKVLNHLGYTEYGTPRLGERVIKQELRVADNEEIMLGGLARERVIRQAAKVPILGSIPVLGYLFGGETESIERSTVVIALRPRIAEAQKNFTGEHQLVMNQATGQTPLPIPETPVGFDQWLFE